MKQIAKRILLGCLILGLLFSSIPAISPNAEAFTPRYDIIRIGLNAFRSWNPMPNVRLDNPDGLRIGSFNSQREFVASNQTVHTQLTVTASGGNLTVTNASGAVVFSGTSVSIGPVNPTQTTTYTLPNASFGGNIRSNFDFFGGFRFNAQGNVMTGINYVNIEDYIKGVVPYEAVPSWPIEVLKAQAVTARTFAVRNFNRNGSHGFDLSNSTFCQVYRGMHGATAHTNRSVTETAGRVIVHNGQPIEAVYHAASGGATENSINVWVTQLPYLMGVDDSRETRPAAITWERTLTPTEFLQHMRGRVSNFGLNDIADIQTVLTPMGNMYSVTFVASNGQTRSFSRSAARSSVATGLHPTFNSQRFTITRNEASPHGIMPLSMDDITIIEHTDFEVYPLLDPDIFEFHSEIEIMQMAEEGLIPRHVATYEAIEALNSGGLTFTVRNYGFGHNVGMSQWGAQALANLGYTYAQIIHHYYTNVQIVGGSGGQTPTPQPPTPPQPPQPPSGNFVDVPQNEWFFPHVSYVREHNLMNGVSNTHFLPREVSRRGEFVAILARMAGFNASAFTRTGIVNITPGTSLNLRTGPSTGHGVVRSIAAGSSLTVISQPSSDWYRVSYAGQTGYVSRAFIRNVDGAFADVSPGAWYAPYAAWARQHNITTGVGNNQFAAQAALSRQDMAVMLYNYINSANITLTRNTNTPAFSDIDSVSTTARPAVVALQQAGIILGVGDGRFHPQGTTDRASIASLIRNFHEQYG